MRRVRFRKNTIFCIYLSVLLFCCIGGVVWVLAWQARYHARRIDDLKLRLVEVESRLASSSSSPTALVPSPSRIPTPIEKAVAKEREELYWIEGHGFNKRYAYLDIEFKDGYRARYYFRPFPSRGELVTLHRRISHDAVAHYWEPDLDYDI